MISARRPFRSERACGMATTETTRHGNTVTATTTFTPKRSYQPMGSRGGGYKPMGGGGYKPIGR